MSAREGKEKAITIAVVRAGSTRTVRLCVVDPHCLEDLQWWAASQPSVVKKALRLMEEVLREPFSGTGKPEALKGLANTWSRRLTEEHRLVYLVKDDRVVFVQARYHY